MSVVAKLYMQTCTSTTHVQQKQAKYCHTKRVPTISDYHEHKHRKAFAHVYHTQNQPMLPINAIRSARSLSFLIPANTIFVPGMYFFGLIRYSNKCLSDQMMPEFLFASEYPKPSTVPD